MIRLAAYFQNQDGWGRHARSFARALNRYEPTKLVEFCGKRNRAQALFHRWRRRLSKDSVGIALGAIEQTPTLSTRYRVAFSVWETSRIPGPSLFFLHRADMVWTPSNWGRQLLEKHGVPPENIRVVPEGVDTELFVPLPSGQRREAVFRFLCVGKWEERKGTADLVRAFSGEFDPAEPVELLMHCGTAWARARDFREDLAREMARAGSPAPRIVASEHVGVPEFIALMQRCHAFVLPTRAEAWGLPILEAMACGLPCIVTDYSGLREYANPDNCFLIRMEAMRKVHDPEFYDAARDWGEWAQPDLGHLRRLMRFAYENREVAMEKARRAREDAERYWTWDRAAQAAMAHVHELRAARRR